MHRRLVLLSLLAVAGGPSRGQDPVEPPVLAQARALHAGRKVEEAAMLLRRALADGGLGEGAAAVQSLLDRYDVRDARRRRAEQQAAEPVVAFAAAMRARGWDRAAGAAADWLRGLDAGWRARAAERQGSPPPPDLRSWFGDGEPADDAAEWEWTPAGELLAKDVGGRTVLLAGVRRMPAGSARLELEFAAPGEPARVALLLGCADARRCIEFAFERAAGGECALLASRRMPGEIPVPIRVPVAPPEGNVRLSVEIEGERLRARCAGGPPLELLAKPRELAGLLALGVERRSEVRPQIRFIALRAGGSW
jgi:hypothetical protein